MSIIHRDYLTERTREQPFPRDLAAAIARKADHLARCFEAQAIEQMVKDAKRALRQGATAESIAQELGL